jgi:thymidylate synthase
MLGLSLRTADIRELFKALLTEKKFTTINREASMTSLVGNTTIEIIGASFIADEDSIFGDVNWDYVHREEEWYNSMSLNVNDIPGGAPAIWKAVADKTTGEINSNYGHLIYSPRNGFADTDDTRGYLSQYKCVLAELKQNPESRRATMIYTRPSIWLDYNKGGRSDFICTNAVQYVIRDGALHCIVQMRSNDAIFGLRNDRAWQRHVLEKLAADLNVDVGLIHWQVGSLHIYARHYFLIDHFAKTGELSITKEKYKELYPDSEFV